MSGSPQHSAFPPGGTFENVIGGTPGDCFPAISKLACYNPHTTHARGDSLPRCFTQAIVTSNETGWKRKLGNSLPFSAALALSFNNSNLAVHPSYPLSIDIPLSSCLSSSHPPLRLAFPVSLRHPYVQVAMLQDRPSSSRMCRASLSSLDSA